MQCMYSHNTLHKHILTERNLGPSELQREPLIADNFIISYYIIPKQIIFKEQS